MDKETLLRFIYEISKRSNMYSRLHTTARLRELQDIMRMQNLTEAENIIASIINDDIELVEHAKTREKFTEEDLEIIRERGNHRRMMEQQRPTRCG